MAWINNDGLAVRIAKDEALEGNRGGVATISGPVHVLEVELNFSDLALSASRLINESMINLPRGMRIEKLEILVETAFTSAGAATFSLGLQNLDRSVYSVSGLIASQTVASLTAGAVITITTGSGTAGALVGTALASPGLICGNASVAAFTAGKAMVRIYGYMP